MFSEDEKQKFANALNEKLQKQQKQLKCPMCNHNRFAIADAYLRNDLQENLKNVNLGGPSIPSIAIICNNCGFLSQHAIGVLGFLKNEVKDVGVDFQKQRNEIFKLN